MSGFIETIQRHLFEELGQFNALSLVTCALILLFGWVITRIVRHLMKPLDKRLSPIAAQVLRHSAAAVIWCFIIVHALHSVGVDVVSILGAAGVAGIAIGFASQTALSNVISGMFILGERGLKPGDYVHTGNFEGTVESIRLLSVTLRRPDNSLLRVPCETLIKTPVINDSAYPVRRCDIEVGVEYGTDLTLLESTARRIVSEQPDLLAEPAPVLRFGKFADSSVNITVCAWCKADAYYDTRYRMAKALYEGFTKAGISFAFPVRTLVESRKSKA